MQCQSQDTGTVQSEHQDEGNDHVLSKGKGQETDTDHDQIQAYGWCEGKDQVDNSFEVKIIIDWNTLIKFKSELSFSKCWIKAELLWADPS